MNNGEKFLNKLYKDLANKLSEENGLKPEIKIQNMLNKLEKVGNNAVLKNRVSLLKHFYYKKYVIKPEDFPDSYFELQKKIALNQGYGHINISPQMKKDLINNVIEDQKSSLDNLIDYFMSDDSQFYPMWAKYWAFQGIIKFGSYNKETLHFSKRSSGSTSPFIELNREALALSIDYLTKYVNDKALSDDE